jgi:undecaprenyl diphosphate synthase
MVASQNAIPRHIGVIMDGNGRWAKARGLPRVAGHREGARAVDRIVTACRERGIAALTLYAFSSQNWSRPSFEVQALMTLLGDYLRQERKKILQNNIRLHAIGAIDRMPENTRRALAELMDVSRDNTGMILTLALSYGGKEEIISAARTLCERVSRGEIQPGQVDENLFKEALPSGWLGPLDLLIRTSGELRISNFMLFSMAYAELVFSEKMWPDFAEADLDDALAAYACRERRFGEVKNP